MKKILLLFFSFTIITFGLTELVIQPQAAEMPPIAGKVNVENKTSLLPGPEPGDSKKAGEKTTPITSQRVQDYVNNELLPGLTNTFFVFLLSISVGAIIIAGIFYIISNGDTEKTKRAKDILLWTILGVAIAAASYAIIQLIINTNFLG